MTADWQAQIQDVIDLIEDRIRRLEFGEISTGDADTTRERIETERAIIARLQRTIDALNATVANGP